MQKTSPTTTAALDGVVSDSMTSASGGFGLSDAADGPVKASSPEGIAVDLGCVSGAAVCVMNAHIGGALFATAARKQKPTYTGCR